SVDAKERVARACGVRITSAEAEESIVAGSRIQTASKLSEERVSCAGCVFQAGSEPEEGIVISVVVCASRVSVEGVATARLVPNACIEAHKSVVHAGGISLTSLTADEGVGAASRVGLTGVKSREQRSPEVRHHGAQHTHIADVVLGRRVHDIG